MNGIFDWLKQGSSGATALEQKSAGGLVAFHASGAATWSMLENGGNARTGFCRNPVVYRCVTMVAQAASSIPLKVCDAGVDCDIHPVLELLDRPNPRQSGVQLLESLYSHLLISGNAYLMRVITGDETREVHVLDPSDVSVADDEDGWPTTYRHSAGSRQTVFSAEGRHPEILALNLFNPLDPVRGMSPIAAAHMALDIHNAASEWNKALLDNSARPSGALVYAAASGENLTDDQFDRLKSELEAGYAGTGQAGRPMVLEGGLDWKAMGLSPRDMDFLEAKNGAAREIALAFGVPPMLLGIPGDNTYSNYREANLAFWTQTVLPLAEKIANRIGHWLSHEGEESPTLGVARDRLGALSAERDARWARINAASFLTDNEKREALGFVPLEEFDDDPG